MSLIYLLIGFVLLFSIPYIVFALLDDWAIKKYNTFRQHFFNFDQLVNTKFNDIYASTDNIYARTSKQKVAIINEYLIAINKELNFHKKSLLKLQDYLENHKIFSYVSFIKYISENEIKIQNNVNDFIDLIESFWNDFIIIDQQEKKIADTHKKLDLMYKDLISKYSIPNLNFQKAINWTDELFNNLIETKISMNYPKYNYFLVQLIHRIKNKIHLLRNIIMILNSIKIIEEANKNSMQKVQEITFLTEDKIKELKQFNHDFNYFINNQLADFIYNSKFVNLNNLYLNNYYQQALNWLNISSQNNIGGAVFDKYKKRFYDDFSLINDRINKVNNVLEQLKNTSKNYQLKELDQLIFGLNEANQKIISSKIDKNDIKQNVDFIVSTQAFYTNLQKLLLYLNELSIKLTKWNHHWNALIKKIITIYNKKIEIQTYLENKNIFHDLSNDIFSEDFEYVEKLFQKTNASKDFDPQILIDNELIIHQLNLINQRFDYVIEYINQTQLWMPKIYDLLYSKVNYYGVNYELVKQNFANVNWNNIVEVSKILSEFIDNIVVADHALKRLKFN
ncbi:hypothetical protein [Ureaplasma urealyticum]|uniref:hypothetical protein n=1 Tax=Ureaplasma urealyticum TaxID=2130 RepID=UPI002913091A|nr:hypothetical protein [Ureaplasma urealyticum]MDU3864525.1 hypothetical protein [Ureaplasma urealyticum]